VPRSLRRLHEARHVADPAALRAVIEEADLIAGAAAD
jgi:hypothetical protein